MKLLIVRHGQSANNVIMHKINARRAKGEISGKEAEAEWLSDRVDDPTLTEEGLFEARQLASFYAPVFKAGDWCAAARMSVLALLTRSMLQPAADHALPLPPHVSDVSAACKGDGSTRSSGRQP